MSYRVGCWETCIKMQIEIYTSYSVCDLLLSGYGVTCIKILVRNLYKLYRIWFIIRRLRCDLYKNIGKKFIQGIRSEKWEAESGK